MPPSSFSSPSRILPVISAALLGLTLPGIPTASAQGVFPEDADAPLMLDPLVVEDDDPDSPGYDPTGLGGAEAERSEPPFANELLIDVGMDDLSAGEIDSELAAIAAGGGDAAEIAAGSERLDLRGFPTPRRRNGFSLAGIPETLNSERSETISASLVPVVGRAAPGGIKNSTTARPRGRVTRSLDAGFSTSGQRRASARATGVVAPKKAWYHASVGVNDQHGPQEFSTLTQTSASAAIAIRHSRATSTLWQFDAIDVRGNPAPGIPQYRATPTGPILGYYLPLADFHTHGPNASVGRQAASLGFQLENAISPDLSLSSGTQLYRREATQDRFTSGQYVESTGKFSGVREPTHREESYTGLVHQTDLTRRLEALGASHKLRVGVEATHAGSTDKNRGIEPADRATYLPPDVLLFDPEAPNYYRPAYSDDVYRRVITDQDVRLGYAALAADTRSAFNRGRTVFTSGLRYDLSRIEVEDRRVSASVPHAEKTDGSLSFHLGANQRVGKRVLLFANTSSAVEPSTRVDSRTGEIQENESTHGYEFGARTVLLERTLSLSAIAYRYINSDIARRNPLYNDPVADPDQTQPQLVTSGEEEFRGFSVQGGWKPVPTWTVTARAAWLDAVTIASPDIPEEEGLPLTRVPEFTAGAGVRRGFLEGRLRGLSLSGSVTYVGEVVQNYARSDRVRIDYPAYTVVGVGAGFTLPRGKVVHTFSANISNLLDENLLAKINRVNAGRSLSAGWRVAF